MKNLFRVLPVLLLMIFVSSCKKDFLNTSPKDQYSDVLLWKDPNLINAYVNGIYQRLHYGHFTLHLSSCVDETMGPGYWSLSTSNSSFISPSDLNVFDANYWGEAFNSLSYENAYKNIRACNVFFDNIDKAKYDTQAEKDNIVGAVTFLRAYIYHWLVAMYGGVPIITKSYTLTDDFVVPRNTYKECIDFISGECDKAAALLPVSGDKVRATKGAALALKSRTLLYAASDFANSNVSWAVGYSNPELVGYVGGDRTALWQAAKAAAKAVIDLNAFSLYNPNPASIQDATSGYANLFINNGCEEDIFLITYDNLNGSWPQSYYQQAVPNGWHGWGLIAPVNQLVDSYEMIDGSKFNWSNPAHKAAPYVNRDPRFYATIFYNGAYWKPRPSDVISRDPLGLVQTGYYEQPDGTFKGGLDTKDGVDDWNSFPLGYFTRKFMDPAIDVTSPPQKTPATWIAIRYGEILLNYAEACIELGQEDEAKLYLNKIRTRAKMPDITATGQALKDQYRNERRVELALEEHRFFDVRRWMIADQAYHGAQGVNITYNLLPGGGYAPPVYEINPVIFEAREFKNNYYLLPISLAEMNKNSKLIQNPLY